MKTIQHTRSILVTSVMLALASSVFAQTPVPAPTPSTTVVSTKDKTEQNRLVTAYTSFAGSTANAQALIAGLRSGTSITLGAGTTTGTTTSAGTTFTPATGKLGNGEIKIALSLAKAELLKLGITNPTADQLKAALNGGTITTTTGTTSTPTVFKGVLTMRAGKMGWGDISKSLGLKLGDVERNERADKPGRPDKVEGPQKVEHPDRVERPERVVRPERVERPERAGK